MIILMLAEWVIPAGFMVFAVSLAATVLWRKASLAKQRSAEMEALAASLGLQFSSRDAFGLIRQLKEFRLFDRERRGWFSNGKILNVMKSWVGQTEVYLFDYVYTVQAGNSRKTIAQTVFFANDKNWYLPNFYMKPEKWWHKLQMQLGLDKDINFEENPEFSDKFWLKSDFEGLVRKQFNAALQGFFCERPPAHLEGQNYYLLAYKPRKLLSPTELKSFFNHCCELVRMMQEKGALEGLDLAAFQADAIKPTPEPQKISLK